MVDFATQTRHHGYRYNAPDIRTAASSYRDIYRENAQKLFKTQTPQVHDCRPEVIKKITDPQDWEVWMFASGLKDSHEGATALHKIRKHEGNEPTQRDKLLFTIGQRGSLNEQFEFPRAVAPGKAGEIFVADSGNHRIQKYNQFGVFLCSFGGKGAGPAEFREPSGLTILNNGFLAVADRRNKRVQILTDSGEFRYQFGTVGEPYFVRSDRLDNIVVSTTSGTVEVYHRTAKLQHRFQIPGLFPEGDKNGKATCPIALNNKDEVIVANPVSFLVQFFTYFGELLYQFEPKSAKPGLTCQPAGLWVNPVGEILVADALNHVVGVYSERGSLLAKLVGPTDDAGAVQSVAVGSEGHLVTSECSVTGEHCIKVFRYRDCKCHRDRPGSGKKRPAEITQ